MQGGDGSQVMAIPGEDYFFGGWSDGVGSQARIDTDIQADLSVQASFIPAISLSGTASYTRAGLPVDLNGWMIGALTDLEHIDSLIGTGEIGAAPHAWSFDVPAQEPARAVYFVLADPNGGEGFISSQATTISDGDLPGIELSFATASGSFMNFTAPGALIAVLDTSSLSQLAATELGYTEEITGNGAWTMIMDAGPLPADVHFIVIDGNNFFLADNALEITSAGISGLVLDKEDFSPWTPPSAAAMPGSRWKESDVLLAPF
jgi:hypothetical protein